MFLFNFFILLLLIITTHEYPEQGKWRFTVKNKSCNFFHVNKALFKGSTITLKVTCDPAKESINKDTKIKIGLLVRQSPCFEEYFEPFMAFPETLEYYYFCPVSPLSEYKYTKVSYFRIEEKVVQCDHFVGQNLLKNPVNFYTEVHNNSYICNFNREECDSYPPPIILNKFNIEYDTSDYNVRKKRSIPVFFNQFLSTESDIVVPEDSNYLVILYMKSISNNKFDASINIEIKSDYGYLSANDYPFLIFYGVMCLVYLSFAIGWLVVSAMQWRDLLRIQFWIGAVIFLGMLEKAVFYSEYQSINSTGQSVKGAILFAEVVSCLKRTLSRMLVIIVSLGFGIVKPRLGPMLLRVICVGVFYFVLSVIEAFIRVYKPKNEPSNRAIMADVPLAVLDSIICWWVFSSLVQTNRTLKLRKNMVKLNLYRKFTNVLYFAVVASIFFMLWVYNSHKMSNCLSEWKNLWFDTAYWQILFSILLLVIMILWRPTNNNQRFAFTPLLDASDDETETSMTTVHDSYGLKLRHIIHTKNDTQDILFDRNNKSNEVEMPSTLMDSALPILIDSDEELLSTKVELSKIE